MGSFERRTGLLWDRLFGHPLLAVRDRTTEFGWHSIGNGSVAHWVHRLGVGCGEQRQCVGGGVTSLLAGGAHPNPALLAAVFMGARTVGAWERFNFGTGLNGRGATGRSSG